MSTEINIIKPALMSLFNKGKTETEAYEDISKSHSSYPVSLKLVNFWFKKFRSGEDILADKKKRGPKLKFSDEFLISLVNENPELNMAQLAKIVDVSSNAISKRLKKINIDLETTIYKYKSYPRGKLEFTDEFLINLVKENPELNMAQLAKIVDVSSNTISKRLKKININLETTIYKYKSYRKGKRKFTDEFLINLINENPGLNKTDIAKLAKCTCSTVSNRINKINNRIPSEDKISLPKHKDKLKKDRNMISDEFLISLVNDNPEYNITQLAKLADSSNSVISNRLKKINCDGDKAKYTSKKSKDGTTKLTQESIIKLVKENPDLKLAELAELANTSITTLSVRLKQINKNMPADQKITLKTIKSKRNKSKNIVAKEEVAKLVNENPELTITELAKLSDTSTSTLFLKLKQINSDVETANYIDKKSWNGTKKLTEEFLIKLVNENPKLNMSELAKLANTSLSTMSRRLKKIKSDKKLKYQDKR